ncbi:MAG TPA: hypothetical protein VN920_12625 [Pyrinomonadaceae bacterium]|nr:hypothetical protein [Pyrinomonadaceae bacterium]
MTQEQVLTERRELLAQLTSLTATGSLHWERQVHSAHRYAKWRNTLLILGPTDSLDDHKIPRYLFLTPLNSPAGTEITSENTDLRASLLALVYAVEAATSDQEPRDPFALSEQALPGSE